MRFKQLTVLIEKVKVSGLLIATVINYSADGMVKGKNILAGRNVYELDRAKELISKLLEPFTDNIFFEVSKEVTKKPVKKDNIVAIRSNIA